MMTADEGVDSQLAGNCPPDDEVSKSVLCYKVASSTARMKTKGLVTQWEEMLTHGTKMTIVDGSVTITLILSSYDKNMAPKPIQICSSCSFSKGWSDGISSGIRKWVPVLSSQ